MFTEIQLTKWFNEDTITLCAGDYIAEIIPSIGGNLIKLENKAENISILRKIKDFEEYKNDPSTFGIPVLLPPNRIDKGHFILEDEEYQFQINEPDKNNSLHGFVQDKPWKVTKKEIKDNKAIVELTFDADKNTDFFKYYPHEFVCKNTYELSENGLRQNIEIINKSNRKMPLGIGFHTAFNLKWSPECDVNKSKVRFSIKKRIELNERLLPTGKLLDLDENELKFRTIGQNPLYTSMDNHYTSELIGKEGQAFHGAIIENDELNLRIVYEVGSKYKHWMIWNKEASSDFVCIEPQTWRINTPNLDLPYDESGYIILNPDKTFSESSKIYLEKSDKNLDK